MDPFVRLAQLLDLLGLPGRDGAACIGLMSISTPLTLLRSTAEFEALWHQIFTAVLVFVSSESIRLHYLARLLFDVLFGKAYLAVYNGHVLSCCESSVGAD